MKKNYYLLIIVLLISAGAFAQDKIHKRNGEIINVKVLEIGNEEIKYKIFEDQNGPLYSLPKHQVSKIIYESGREENYQNPAKNNTTKYDTSGDKRAQNIFIELAGQGLLFTANYDTRFDKRRDGLGARAGIGFVAADGNSLLTVPLSLNYLLGKGNKFFELGLGATYIGLKGNQDGFFDDNESNIIGTMAFMYRYQPEYRGFSFRGGLTPVFNSDFFMPYYFGLSLGYTF
jgi:hypothetical protein